VTTAPGPSEATVGRAGSRRSAWRMPRPVDLGDDAPQLAVLSGIAELGLRLERVEEAVHALYGLLAERREDGHEVEDVRWMLGRIAELEELLRHSRHWLSIIDGEDDEDQADLRALVGEIDAALTAEETP
jgi:hypothetical protein